MVEHDSCDNCINSQNRVANVNSRCSVDLADDVNDSSACSREGDHSLKVVVLRGRSHPIVDVRDSLRCTSVKIGSGFPHDFDEHGDCSVRSMRGHSVVPVAMPNFRASKSGSDVPVARLNFQASKSGREEAL